MKAKHWINLIGVTLMAGMITFLALRWAISSYAEPTCRRYAETHGQTYVTYFPPDLASADIGTTHMSRDGNCQLRTASGTLETKSLVGASSSGLGASLLVSFALGWEIVFMVSFFCVALALALVTQVFTPGKATA